MKSLSNQLTTIVENQDTAGFSHVLENLEPKIGSWGGRSFKIASFNGQVTANQIVKFAKELFFEIEHDQEKRKVFDLAIRTFKALDATEDPKSSWFVQVLTFLRRFFGNFGYNRSLDVKALEKALLEPIKGHHLIGHRTACELHSEYKSVPHSHFFLSPLQFRKALCNMHLNRFLPIIPYDANRFYSPGAVDYINASWLLNKTAIATQAPQYSEQSQSNFWKMVHTSGSTQIAMVTNLMEGRTEKSAKYWPDVGETRSFHDVSITGVKEEILFTETASKQSPFIVMRELDVQFKGEKKQVRQYQLVNWMDMDVVSPDVLAKLVTFLKPPSEKEPLIVHCTAGVGRTGTLIATRDLYHKTIAQGKRLKKYDLYNTVTTMRSHPTGRVYMVGTPKQYTLVWQSLERLARA